MSYFNWCFPNSQSGWQSRGHQRDFVGQLKVWNKALWGSKALTLSSSCGVIFLPLKPEIFFELIVLSLSKRTITLSPCIVGSVRIARVSTSEQNYPSIYLSVPTPLPQSLHRLQELFSDGQMFSG